MMNNESVPLALAMGGRSACAMVDGREREAQSGALTRVNFRPCYAG
jgi:hypothetical protein